MIGSRLLYLVLGIAGTLLAHYAQKTNKAQYVWWIILCVTVIAGLRSVNVGIDTKTYNQMFINIAAGNYGDVFGAEKTFVWIVRFLQIPIKSPVYVFLMLSLLTNTLILFRLWDFRKITSFSVAFAYYYACFYFFSFNIVRQMVAVAIAFWGTRFVQKEKYFSFLVMVAVAAMFHQTALICLLYFIVDVVWKNKWDWRTIWKEKVKGNKKILIPVLCVAAVCVAFLVIKACDYISYFSDISFDFGLLVPMRLAFVAAYVIIVKVVSGKWGGKTMSGITSFFNRNVVCYYAFGLGISMLGYMFPYVDRIGLYFAIYGCPFLGYVYKKAKHPICAIAAYVVIVLLPFAMDLMGGGQGQLPYAFFGQN